MAKITSLSFETNLGFTFDRQCAAGDTTVYLKFFNRITGVATEPIAANRTNLIVVADKGSEGSPNANYEIMVLGTVGAASGGVSTCTGVIRNVTFATTAITAGTGKIHQAGGVGGCADVADLWWQVYRVLDGTYATNANNFRVGDETASDIKYYWHNDQTLKPYIYYDESGGRPRVYIGDDALGALNNDWEVSCPIGTTAQLAAMSNLPATGMIAGDTTLGEVVFREGGAWVQKTGGGSVPDASTTVAGKVEEATPEEVAKGTAAGATGARLFVNPSTLNVGASLTTGEGVTAGNALRVKEDGLVYNAEKFKQLSAWMEANNGEDPNTVYKAACSINTNKVVYIHEIAGKTRAMVATWDGDVPTFGAAVDIGTGWTTSGRLDVCKVDTDKFAVVHWADTAVGIDDGEIVICTVATVTITAGTSVAFDTGSEVATDLNRVCSPATDVVSVVWRLANSHSQSITATVVTRTPTFGAAVEISDFDSAGDTSDICDIDTNKVVIVHEGTDDDLYAEVCTIAGNTMTEGADTELVDGISILAASVRVAKVGTNKFAAVYDDGTNFKIICSTVSGTTITPGTPVTVPTNAHATAGVNAQIIYLSNNRCLLAFTDLSYAAGVTSPANIVKAFIVSFTGTVPTLHQVFNSLYLPQPDTWAVALSLKDLVNINGDQFQIFANDGTGNDNYVLNFADNNFIGFAGETKNVSEAVSVGCLVDTNQTGLVTGAKYYLAANGALALTGDYEAGTALSATKILKK